MDYDPKLRRAAKDIQEILKRYDITGYVVLTSEDASEFLYHVEASWSAVRHEPVGAGKMGFRIRTTDIKDPKRKQHVAERTAHMIHSSRDLVINAAVVYEGLAERCETAWRTEHRSLIGRAPDSSPINPKDPNTH